jgi:hypothetical protein
LGTVFSTSAPRSATCRPPLAHVPSRRVDRDGTRTLKDAATLLLPHPVSDGDHKVPHPHRMAHVRPYSSLPDVSADISRKRTTSQLQSATGLEEYCVQIHSLGPYKSDCRLPHPPTFTKVLITTPTPRVYLLLDYSLALDRHQRLTSRHFSTRLNFQEPSNISIYFSLTGCYP